MRIAIFYNLAFGGAKRVVQEHVKGLTAKGHIVDVYTTDASRDIFNPSLFANETFYYFFDEKRNSTPFVGRFFSDYQNFFVLKKLHKKIAKAIDKNKYDLVIAHPDKLTQSPFILRFLKTPSLYYCQEPLRIVHEYSFRFKENVNLLNRVYEELTRYYRKQIDITNVRSASMTLASCYHVRERMIISYDVTPKVSYLGVDDKVFKPLSLKKKREVFFVGSKDLPLDGFDLAQEALMKIPKNIRPELRIVSWKKQNGERLTENELVEQYNVALLILCMSRLETFGLVPLESMACGTPVIATNVSGHRETVVNGKTGFLVDFDPMEIAEKIQLLIKNEELRKKMEKDSRKHIQDNWSWDRRINELEESLQDFLKKQ